MHQLTIQYLRDEHLQVRADGCYSIIVDVVCMHHMVFSSWDAHLFMSLAELRRLCLGLGRDLTGLQAWWTRLGVDSSGACDSLLLTAELG